MTANEEILKKVYEINQELGSFDNINNEEPIEEIIEEEPKKENSPVYVLEDSIPDVLELNNVNKEIEKKTKEKDDKEDEITSLKNQRQELSEKIGIINNGDHINEVALNLKELRELDKKLFDENAVLEEIYKDLMTLEEKGKSLDKSTREMVDKMTRDYNDKVNEYTSLVKDYIEQSNSTDFDMANTVLESLNEYKKFETFDSILKGDEAKAPEVPVKEEEKPVVEEKVSEPTVNVSEEKIDVPNTERIDEPVTELTEVKVDTIEEPKVEDTPIDINQDNKSSIENIVKKFADEPSTIETGSVQPTVEQPKEEVKAPSFDDIAPDKVEEKVEKVIFANKTDKIADSNRKGILSTIETFNSKKIESSDPTLTLTNKNA